MTRIFFFISTCCFFLLASYGCVTEVSSPEELGDVGLDTLPFYQLGSSQFNTQEARKKMVDEKARIEKKKNEIAEKIKSGVVEFGVEDTLISKPWIDPEQVNPRDLVEVLRLFPKDVYGYPDWNVAIAQSLIAPSGTIGDVPEKRDTQFADDIIFKINDALMADVLFSHNLHANWLSCDNCHPSIFIPEKGANASTMYSIWNGESCGKCHGTVAFMPKGFDNCKRCHSISKPGSAL
ncbi:MAG: hypothetical protein KAT46_07570 [Deltaproteobacteria bacterium]|nr:hypothetical protein [Deltaproteobacteria bacterium]